MEETRVSFLHWSFLIPKVGFPTLSYSCKKPQGVGAELALQIGEFTTLLSQNISWGHLTPK